MKTILPELLNALILLMYYFKFLAQYTIVGYGEVAQKIICHTNERT